MESPTAVLGVDGANEKPLYLCPNCNAYKITAARSDRVNDRWVRNVWSCDVCGFEFETAATFTTMADVKLKQSIASPATQD